jgi:integrase/recombinase XerD
MENDEFKTYLKNKSFAPRSINGTCRNIKQLGQWAGQNGHSITKIGYTLIKDYVIYCKGLGLKPSTINGKIRSIGRYNQFLHGENTKDTASQLRVKGTIRDMAFDLFTPSELDSIYNNYPVWASKRAKPDNLARNHIVLGLHVYQGIKHGELAALETYHVDLAKGRVYAPSTGRSNSRYLNLLPFQVMPLHNYITGTREKMLQKYAANQYGQKLFPAFIECCVLELLEKTITKHCPKLKKFGQIRASVITAWLARYNLREAQYMAGHRYVSSTERYSRENIENLKKEVEKYHPLKEG